MIPAEIVVTIVAILWIAWSIRTRVELTAAEKKIADLTTENMELREAVLRDGRVTPFKDADDTRVTDAAKAVRNAGARVNPRTLVELERIASVIREHLRAGPVAP